MPIRNRVDPLGDLHISAGRGMFTGNRGCLVDDRGSIVRHHNGNLWITCVLEYKDWRSPLTAPRHWTPIFFLDEAVALAAGHRPCGLCRRDAYHSYRDAVADSRQLEKPPSASDLNMWLAQDRLRRGRGLERAGDRILWIEEISNLPSGTVISLSDEEDPLLLAGDRLFGFRFSGWTNQRRRPKQGSVSVITPPTSVAALRAGYEAVLHPSAMSPPN